MFKMLNSKCLFRFYKLKNYFTEATAGCKFEEVIKYFNFCFEKIILHRLESYSQRRFVQKRNYLFFKICITRNITLHLNKNNFMIDAMCRTKFLLSKWLKYLVRSNLKKN